MLKHCEVSLHLQTAGVLDSACRRQKERSVLLRPVILRDFWTAEHISCCFWFSLFLTQQTRMKRASFNHSFGAKQFSGLLFTVSYCSIQ